MSDPNRHVMSIFCEALEQASANERAAYLDSACGNDADLHARVEDLLRAHQEAGHFLQGKSTSPGRAATADEQPIPERPGTVIGPYKLIEQLGEGGFGVVYR